MCCSIFKDQILGGLIVFRAALLADSLYIIPLVFTLVKWFFKVFLSFFQLFLLYFSTDKCQDYFKSPFGRPRYITTFVPVCQVLLGIFLKYFESLILAQDERWRRA